MPLREVNDATVELIRAFEGIPDGDPTTVNLDPYPDPIGIWTIGWGHAVVDRGAFVRGPDAKARARALYPGGITLDQAVSLLRADLLDTGKDVLAATTADCGDNRFGALVSFAFNVGIGNLRRSTLLRRLNAGDADGAADEFPKWNRAGGRVLPGLTRRRLAERALFLKP